jgi:hypothetical protein
MKQKLVLLFAPLMQGFLQAQTFQNLDFEHATIVPYGNGSDSLLIQASAALLDWTVYLGSSPWDYVVYDTVTLGSPAASLQDSLSPFPPLQGNYSVILQHSTGGSPTSAAIGQIGHIPVTAESLVFDAANYNNLLVTFAGNPLSLIQVGIGSDYSVLGANISAYAGQTGELVFADISGGSEWLTLDDIQFSSATIPEPSAFALISVGALVVHFRRWKSNSRWMSLGGAPHSDRTSTAAL